MFNEKRIVQLHVCTVTESTAVRNYSCTAVERARSKSQPLVVLSIVPPHNTRVRQPHTDSAQAPLNRARHVHVVVTPRRRNRHRPAASTPHSPARTTPRPAASRGRFTSRARRAPRPPARSAGRRRSPPTECPGPGPHAWQQPASPHAPAPSPVWPGCVRCTAPGAGGGVRTRVPRPPPAGAAWTGG